MTKHLLVALSVLAVLSGTAAQANEIINVTPVQAKITEDGKQVIEMPDKKTTSRRRMLVDFGLFGAGVHVGWMKPRNIDLRNQKLGNGGETVEVKKRRGVGYPIFNMSAGSHALGLGTK
jgi:hypothetical protein